MIYRRMLLSATVVAGLFLSGCEVAVDPAHGDETPNKAHVVIGGKELPCLTYQSINIRTPITELEGKLRSKFLTPEAESAGVRVWISSNEVTDYGSMVIRYTNPGDTCILWAETLSLQEYANRLGLNPLSVSSGYEPSTTNGDTNN